MIFIILTYFLLHDVRMMQLFATIQEKRKEPFPMNIKRLLCGTLAAALLILPGCKQETQEPVDPHEGMIQVLYGSQGYLWVDDQEGVPVSTFAEADFSADGQYKRYDGGAFTSKTGVDVSEHQLEIDWAQVKAAGIDFAMIRAGYRGSTQGGLYTDEYFYRNIQGALDAGLEVGAYFFSQATSRAEAVAEASFLTALLEDYKDRVTMPVVFDWEETGSSDARTAGIENRQISECAQAFCQAVEREGYTPCVYLNRHMGYYQYDLSLLTDYMIWFAGEGSYPDFHFRHSMWQYTFSGQVDGIPTEVDLDLYMDLPPVVETTPEPTE